MNTLIPPVASNRFEFVFEFADRITTIALCPHPLPAGRAQKRECTSACIQCKHAWQYCFTQSMPANWHENIFAALVCPDPPPPIMELLRGISLSLWPPSKKNWCYGVAPSLLGDRLPYFRIDHFSFNLVLYIVFKGPLSLTFYMGEEYYPSFYDR